MEKGCERDAHPLDGFDLEDEGRCCAMASARGSESSLPGD